MEWWQDTVLQKCVKGHGEDSVTLWWQVIHLRLCQIIVWFGLGNTPASQSDYWTWLGAGGISYMLNWIKWAETKGRQINRSNMALVDLVDWH